MRTTCFISIMMCLLLAQRDVAGGERFEDLLEGWAEQRAKIQTIEFHYRCFARGGDALQPHSPDKLNEIITSTEFTSQRENFRALTDQLLKEPLSLPVPWSDGIFVLSGIKLRDDRFDLYIEDGVNQIYKQRHPGHETISINGFPGGGRIATQSLRNFMFLPSDFDPVEGVEIVWKQADDGRHLFLMMHKGEMVGEFQVHNRNLERITIFSEGQPYRSEWYRDYRKYDDGIQIPTGVVTASFIRGTEINLVTIQVIDQCQINLPKDDTLFRMPGRKGAGVHDFRKPEPRGAALHEDTDDVTVEVIRAKPSSKSR